METRSQQAFPETNMLHDRDLITLRDEEAVGQSRVSARFLVMHSPFISDTNFCKTALKK